MQLTLFTDYALRMLTYLALADGEVVPVNDIADATGVSKHYMLKVGNELARFGYVDTVRGRTGGVRLVMDPARIKLGEVVRSMEPTRAVMDCISVAHSDCPIVAPCRLRHVLEEAQSAFHAVLDRYTLADLVSSPQALRKALHLPVVP
jgi:Rrf2 family nitric oxide-sensitive transcriptional repressor